MKCTVVLLLAVGLSRAAVLPGVQMERYHAMDEPGRHSFGHTEGQLAKTEVKTAEGITSGGYSYVGTNGLLQTTSYLADTVHLPVGPSVHIGHAYSLGGPVLAAPALVASHVVAAPTVVAAAPAFIAAPAIAAPMPPAQPEVAAEEPAVAAPESDDTVAVEAAAAKDAPAQEEAPAVADDTVAVEAAAPKDAPAEVEAAVVADDAPLLPGPAPEPVQDTPEVALARAEHLAAIENTKMRNAMYEASRRVVSKTFVPTGAAFMPGPAVFTAPAITKTVISAPAPVIPAPAPVVAAPALAVAAPAVTRTVFAAHAAPVVHAPSLVSASQYHSQDELGQYSYGYFGGLSSKHEAKNALGMTSGGYSYLDANGLVQSASYVSDPVNGFRVSATNLPVQPAPQYLADTPEVAEVKERLFKAQAEHMAKL